MQDRQKKRRARAGLVHVSRVTPGENRYCTSHASKQNREEKEPELYSFSRSFRADVRDILEGPVLSSLLSACSVKPFSFFFIYFFIFIGNTALQRDMWRQTQDKTQGM